MLFFKALTISILVHLVLVLGLILRIPKMDMAIRPDTHFLGGILSLSDVMPFMVQDAVMNRIEAQLPEWETDITFRRWLHQQQVSKQLSNVSLVSKKQYKSDLGEFDVQLSRESDLLMDDLGIDMDVPSRMPLKLLE